MEDTMDLSLSPAQYGLVFNLFSLTVATMAAAGVFLLASRGQVAPRYRTALTISAVVVFVAAYHYVMILQSWKASFTLADGAYVPSGIPFNDAYRYADWLITVPLLLVELVAVLGLAREQARPLLRNLSIAAFAMIALGYPGEVASDAGTAWLFWGLSMVPFLYILYTLIAKLNRAVADQGSRVKSLLSTTRGIILVSWWVYPIAYLLPMFGLSGAAGEVGLQVGYSIADLTAKALFGLYVYRIARAKSDDEGYQLAAEPSAAGAA
jgi:bacteriorhodopsin